jgi:hypothetical protein
MITSCLLKLLKFLVSKVIVMSDPLLYPEHLCVKSYLLFLISLLQLKLLSIAVSVPAESVASENQKNCHLFHLSRLTISSSCYFLEGASSQWTEKSFSPGYLKVNRASEMLCPQIWVNKLPLHVIQHMELLDGLQATWHCLYFGWGRQLWNLDGSPVKLVKVDFCQVASWEVKSNRCYSLWSYSGICEMYVNTVESE